MIISSPGRQLSSRYSPSSSRISCQTYARRNSALAYRARPASVVDVRSMQRGGNAMKRLLIGAVSALTLTAFSLPAASSALAAGGPEYGHPFCEQNAATCTEL